jgi:hypothetical protein
MSEVKFSCPGCGQHISCDAALGGQQIACPSCQAAMVVPGGAPAAPEPAPIRSCPSCGAAVHDEAVICTQCGLNLQTGKRLAAQPAGRTPLRRPAPPSSSWVKNSNVWVGVVLAVLGVLFVAGLSNEKAGVVFHVVQALISLGVGILILVAAFQDSVGQGFLTLCVPCYVFYFVFGRCDSSLIKLLFLISLSTRLAGLLIKLPTGWAQ